MLRKTPKVLAWIVGGLIGLSVALYLVIVAINWRDAEPSADVLRMSVSYRDRPTIRDEDNALVFAMGFAVAPGESPLEMGSKRVAWLRQQERPAGFDSSTDPLGVPSNLRAAMHPALRAYFGACTPGTTGCAAAFAEASRTFDDWKVSEDWLLERYRTLVGLPGWREEIPTDIAAPLPSFQVVFDGQKLLMLHARNRAARGDAAGVKELLEGDLRFWRRVLASSDLFITKVIAAAALKRHFKLGADALRQLPPERAMEAAPSEWRAPFTETELSPRRWMIGEWIYSSHVFSNDGPELVDALAPDDSIVSKLLTRLGRPAFQLQDTINRSADYFSRAIDLVEGVPLAEYEAAANRVTELSTRASHESWPPRSLYNIAGRILVGHGADYGSYVRRVGDIEGVRRAALAAIELHAAQIDTADAPAALAASELRNPYTDEPFEWDAAEAAVVFRGLEPGDRGVHRID